MWQWQSVVNFFFKASCSLCQRPSNETLCCYCWTKLQQCQFSQPHAVDILPTEQSSLAVVAWGEYTGELRRAIAAFKYENQPLLGQPLGHALGETWNQLVATSPHLLRRSGLSSSPSQPILAVPIPMHAAKLNQRGFNQAALLAASFCRTTGIKLAKHGLMRVRETQAQFSLSAEEREQNLAEAFVPCDQWKRRSPNAHILLIDDIYTTGATVRSAAQALRRIGCRVIGVATLARPRRHTQSHSSKLMHSNPLLPANDQRTSPPVEYPCNR
jgi:ComF family protein